MSMSEIRKWDEYYEYHESKESLMAESDYDHWKTTDPADRTERDERDPDDERDRRLDREADDFGSFLFGMARQLNQVYAAGLAAGELRRDAAELAKEAGI